MASLLVSVAVKRNVAAVIISNNSGVLLFSYAERVKDEDARSNSYFATMYAFDIALRLVRTIIQNDPSIEEVTFELSNSTFIKWMNNQFSKDIYQRKFVELNELLQSIPMRYNFSYNQKPRAFLYAEEKNCKSSKLSSL